jgi:hypothetical protein
MRRALLRTPATTATTAATAATTGVHMHDDEML